MFAVGDRVRYQVVPSSIFVPELGEPGTERIIGFLNQTATVMAVNDGRLAFPQICIKWDCDNYYSWTSSECIRKIA